MEEKKYAVTNVYGYGKIYRYSSRYSVRYYFVENAALSARKYIDKGIKIEPTSVLIKIEPAFVRIKLHRNVYGYTGEPLHLICEEGKWFEFFSHTPVNVIDDKNFKYASEEAEFTAVIDSNSYRSTTDFANKISEYSDAEIADMVNQFLNLIKNSLLWKKGYREALEKKAKIENDEMERMMEITTKRINALSGKYQYLQKGDDPSWDYYKEQSEKRKREEAEQREKLQKADWMAKGKCAFCGGDFKGFFSSRCVKCGKKKSY